jgi:hypothetical protein
MLPSPASSHNDSMSRIDRPLTNPPITNVFKGSVRNSRLQCHFGNGLDTNGTVVWRACGIWISSSPSPVCRCRGTEPVAQPLLVVLQAALTLGATLVASATQPAIELLLDRPLNDQPGTEPRKLGEHLLWVVDYALPKQLVDLGLYLRRRRYGASHGVGLLHRLAGLEGTYAVVLTAPPRLFTAVLRRDRLRVGGPGLRGHEGSGPPWSKQPAAARCCVYLTISPADAEITGAGREWTVAMISELSMPCRYIEVIPRLAWPS